MTLNLQRPSIIIFLITAQITAMGLSVDSLKIQPVNPTENDTILLTAYHPLSTAAILYSQNTLLNDSVIAVHYCYTTSMVFSSIDTNEVTTIGKLPIGNYVLKYTFKQPYYWEVDSIFGCNAYQYYDSASILFTVSSVSGIQSHLIESDIIFPNPATTQLALTIPPPTQPTTATITDINGRLLRKEQLLNATNTLNIAELPAGLYFVAVQSAGQRWVRRFVKQ